MNCKLFPIKPPKVVAVATDSSLTPTNALPDPTNLPSAYVPKYGQDLTFGLKRPAPLGHDVGKTDTVLKPKMEKLLSVFASGDKSGMAKRLFTNFLAKNSSVTYFEDSDLNTAAAGHQNIRFFMDAALNANGSSGKTRIHQALKKAGWDITKIAVPTDLGVPAFNDGIDWLTTGDFNNGLGVMINGVQYVYVIATHYNYDAKAGKYCICLKYVMYDVFGLDDEDLRKKGAKSDGMLSTNAGVGITAWWQLQHQHSYAPIVTRIVLEKTFEVAAV